VADTDTEYGSYKYASYHLLYARWLRKYALKVPYRYVTLAGTKLRDIEHLAFVDHELIRDARAYEWDDERYALALLSRDRLNSLGVVVNIERSSFFSFKRDHGSPHVFFIDIEGIFAWSDYDELLGGLFQEGAIVEGDAIFVTSCLAPRPGWDRIYASFESEYRLLGASKVSEMQELYLWRHPTFTVSRAVECRDLATEMCVECFGTVRYRDRSMGRLRMPMGIWGYVIKPGKTEFHKLVGAAVPCFDMKAGFVASPV